MAIRRDTSFEYLIGIVFIIFAVWFVFFRPSDHYHWLSDYRDYWYKNETKLAFVEYCGNKNTTGVNCWDRPRHLLRITHRITEKESSETKFFHYLTINFDNGGRVDVSGTCDKAAKIMGAKRFCRMESDNGDYYLVFPYGE